MVFFDLLMFLVVLVLLVFLVFLVFLMFLVNLLYLSLMMETCPPFNSSHEKDSKALILMRVG